MRYLWLLALMGCAHSHVSIARELHGGLSPIPSKVSDVGFVAIGAGFDQGLRLLKVPLIPRLAADALAAVSVRSISTFGRTVDSGFMFLLGSMGINIARVFVSKSHSP